MCVGYEYVSFRCGKLYVCYIRYVYHVMNVCVYHVRCVCSCVCVCVSCEVFVCHVRCMVLCMCVPCGQFVWVYVCAI